MIFSRYSHWQGSWKLSKAALPSKSLVTRKVNFDELRKQRMKEIGISHGVQANRWKQMLTLFLLGLPIASGVLLLTQTNWVVGIETWVHHVSNELQEPYRYRFFASLPSNQSPLAGIQHEIAFYQERSQRYLTSGLEKAGLATAYLKMARLTGEGSWYLLAEQTAQQSLALLPFENPEAVLVLARVAEAKHDFAGALHWLKQVDGEREAIALQVTTHLALGDVQVANAAAQALVQQLPSINSYTLLALTQVAQGNHQAALQSFKYALMSEEAGEITSSARTRMLLGRLHYEQGDLEQAEALYREALRILPNHPQTLINLAQLNVRRGNYASADRYYAQIMHSSNGTPRIFDSLVLRGQARIQQLQGNTAAAERLWDQAEKQLRESDVGLSAQSLGHQRDLAQLLLERGRPQDIPEALSLAQAEARKRRDAETLEVLAWALLKADRLQEAKAVIQEAIALGTKSTSLFEHAGSIEQQLGNDAQAQFYFQQIQSIDPTFDAAARRAVGLGAGLGS
jgi:tetratricopeptide (TPR) repeat protein